MKVYGVMGWKNSGKTGLVERLVAEITGRGFTVSTIKHAHHDVDLDQPGKDTYRHRQAGAHEVVLATRDRFVVMHELHGRPEPALADLLARMAPVDLVLVEGYKRDSHPKIEVLRGETGQPLIQPGDPTVRAVAANIALPGLGVPGFDLDDTGGIADFLLADCGLVAAPGAFDTVVVVDWSGKATLSPAAESRDAIWIGVARAAGTETLYQRGRAEAEATLSALFAAERAAGRRVLAGFDFPFAYPVGFAQAVTGQTDPLLVWDWLEARIESDGRNGNNRFALAAAVNASLGPDRPFWSRPAKLDLPDVPIKKGVRYGGLFSERRQVEKLVRKAKPVFQLLGAGSVGSQALLGLPVLKRLRAAHRARVWPFEPPTGPLVFAEIYPGLIDGAVKASGDTIKDRAQVRLLAATLWQLAQNGGLAELLAVGEPLAREEGWILGAGHSEWLTHVAGGLDKA